MTFSFSVRRNVLWCFATAYVLSGCNLDGERKGALQGEAVGELGLIETEGVVAPGSSALTSESTVATNDVSGTEETLTTAQSGAEQGGDHTSDPMFVNAGGCESLPKCSDACNLSQFGGQRKCQVTDDGGKCVEKTQMCCGRVGQEVTASTDSSKAKLCLCTSGQQAKLVPWNEKGCGPVCFAAYGANVGDFAEVCAGKSCDLNAANDEKAVPGLLECFDATAKLKPECANSCKDLPVAPAAPAAPAPAAEQPCNELPECSPINVFVDSNDEKCELNGQNLCRIGAGDKCTPHVCCRNTTLTGNRLSTSGSSFVNATGHSYKVHCVCVGPTGSEEYPDKPEGKSCGEVCAPGSYPKVDPCDEGNKITRHDALKVSTACLERTIGNVPEASRPRYKFGVLDGIWKKDTKTHLKTRP